ncbi:MAG: flagellin [Lachnospiraceae bacterium]
MVVQHNMTAMNANRQLGITTSSQAKVTEKLSSGYKINRAADDAAGLTISEKMRSQIRGLTQASSNAQDGVSCVQTAEGALTEVHSMLQRMNELAVKSANGTNTSADRTAIQKEVKALICEIDRVKQSTQFNTLNLLDGTFATAKAKSVQVGAANEVTQRITIKIESISTGKLGIKNIDMSTLDGARSAISSITQAIAKISGIRSGLGAIQNRLEHTIANLDNIVENTTSAESAIRDTDMATTMVDYTKNSILQQAGQSMLAQANQSTQGVLTLLG